MRPNKKRKTEGGRNRVKARINDGDGETGKKFKMVKITNDKASQTFTRSINLSGGCVSNRNEIRRSARIQSKIPPQRKRYKGKTMLHCAVCDLPISQKAGEHGVVNCTKCTNTFHPACSGIQKE